MNKWIGVGRLTADPQLKFTTGTGIAVTTFTLAIDRPYTGQDGQKQTDFIQVVSWRKLAENVANNLAKGRLVAVSGSIQTRKYQAQDGSNRYATEIIADGVLFLEYPKDKQNHSGNVPEGLTTSTDGDDDIPF